MKKGQGTKKRKEVSELKVIVNGTVDLSIMPPEEMELLASRLEKIVSEEAEAERLKKQQERRL